MHKQSAHGPVPPERYNQKAFYHSDGSRSGSMDVSGGYFLNEDVRQFDNSFFGINNLEATYMDPQQRKLLEVVYECLESAGASMSSVSGSNAGVFVGNFSVDYQPMQTRDPDYLHRYTSTGSGATIMSNRISHVFNLRGPRSVDNLLSLTSSLLSINYRSQTIPQPYLILSRLIPSLPMHRTKFPDMMSSHLRIKLRDVYHKIVPGIPNAISCSSETQRVWKSIAESSSSSSMCSFSCDFSIEFLLNSKIVEHEK